MAPPSFQYRRLRAPRHDGGLLVDPPWDDCRLLPDQNSRALADVDFRLQEESFQDLRRAARTQVVQEALRYTRQYVDAELPEHWSRIILAGHQPELFHPGVWAKNFAIDRLARRSDGVAIQLVVDNDLCRRHGVNALSGSVAEPQVVTVAYDQYQPPLPYEARAVQDVGLFRTFAERLTSRLAPLIDKPLVQEIWPDACEAVAAGKPLGHALAVARHRCERRHGSKTLELPMSSVCETDVFRCFLLDLLSRGELVRQAHNQRLAEYRQLHRLRSNARPVPNLRRTEDWIETPFWMWTAADPRRRPLWTRQLGSQLELGDLAGETWCLDHGAARASSAIDQLRELSLVGLRIRPRALTNTLFARMFVGDLFVHGIGGAKYDQVTDLLLADLYPLEPPPHATLSATVHLPVRHDSMPAMEPEDTKKKIREMHFHPEVFLTPEEAKLDQVSSWVADKMGWIRREAPKEQRRARHEGISRSNARLREFLREKQSELQKQLVELRRRQAACRLLESREWSFCLFPSEFLPRRLLELLAELP